MGVRSLERGANALEEILAEEAACEGKIEVVRIDTSDAGSIAAAAVDMRAKLSE